MLGEPANKQNLMQILRNVALPRQQNLGSSATIEIDAKLRLQKLSETAFFDHLLCDIEGSICLVQVISSGIAGLSARHSFCPQRASRSSRSPQYGRIRTIVG